METQYTVRACAVWTISERTCPLWAARRGALGSMDTIRFVYLFVFGLTLTLA